MTTPPFCGLIARRLWREKHVPYVLWCMDLYPEALIAGGWIRPQGLTARLLDRFARRERCGASAIVTLGQDMMARVEASLPVGRVSEIPGWSCLQPTHAARAEAIALRRERGWLDSDIMLLYSGHIGRAHAVARFAEYARHLANGMPRIRFVIAGSGPCAAAWRAAGGRSLEWLEPVPSHLLVAHLLAANVHVISQKASWAGVVVPSKYQTACALGRPVVFDGPAEGAVAGWIREGDTGWILPPADPHGIESMSAALRDHALLDAKGSNAADQAARLFDSGVNAGRLINLVEGVVR